jgi:hypothetical protein
VQEPAIHLIQPPFFSFRAVCGERTGPETSYSERASLAMFGYRETWDGEEAILKVDLVNLLEMCFGEY